MNEALISKFLIFLSKRSPDVFWIRNADYSQQIYISPAYESIWQRDANELYQYPEKWADYLYPEDFEAMKSSTSQRNQAILPDMEFHTEYRIVRPSGEIRYIKDLSFPIFDMANTHIGFAGIARDITDEVLLNANLLKSKQAAEAANHAKTIFIANMSHDMKTPLSGIVTSAEVIAHDQHSPERDRQFASIISASGKQLESFFTSCLDLSKMEMQEWESQASIFSIKKLVEDIKALYLPKAMSNHLNLEVDIDVSLPLSVEGHRDSLYRVLLNLVGNAIKFTQQGGVTLRARLINHTDDQHCMIQFQVQDTGIGIPEDKHAAIFEKLYRIKPSYESQIEGSGIGLYIVHEFVKRMGGDIQVDSKVGEGSAFTVTLVLKAVANRVLESSRARQSEATATTMVVGNAQLSQETIAAKLSRTDQATGCPKLLLVEDNHMVQFVTKTLLHTAGFTVDIAGSGEEALEIFEPNKYGLIYMDIGLPGMTGYETAKAIREKERELSAAIEVPIIALTGHGAVDVQTFCDDAGMQGVLSKPLSREQAEILWKHFKEDATISVPGLTLLTHDIPEPSPQEILDIEATIKAIGIQDIALNLMGKLADDLKNQLLPQIKALISENKSDELRFLLHRHLGALAYAKAPRLEKRLLELQAAAHTGAQIDPALYQEIENEVFRVIRCCESIDQRTLA